MNLFSWLGGAPVSAAEIRAEVWLLGARTLGQPLEGALEELKDPKITSARAALLRACVRSLRAA